MSHETTDRPDQPAVGQRWETKPWLAAAVRGAVVGAPLVSSFGAARLVDRVLPLAVGPALRLSLLLAVAVAVAVGVERVARRFLPLATLLGLTMLFPDRAPSRFRVARQAGSTRALEERLAGGLPEDEATAAETVLHLVAALTAHDKRTRGHAERVRVYTDLLGEELGLDRDARDKLRWSALLHDIGKLEVAASVLNKAGALDDAEWDAVRQHPALGARLAAPLLPWLGEWGGAIAEHHERFDGRGYPAGLSGEQISTAGRMVCLVDAFEVMTAARSYKKAMATRTAREELSRCAGSQFDPAMVRAFLAISLPRLLWAMGPLSFLLQLPFLRDLRQAGEMVGNLAGTAASAGATGAALAGTATLLAFAPPGLAAAPQAVTAAGAVSSVPHVAVHRGEPPPTDAGPRVLPAVLTSAPVRIGPPVPPSAFGDGAGAAELPVVPPAGGGPFSAPFLVAPAPADPRPVGPPLPAGPAPAPAEAVTTPFRPTVGSVVAPVPAALPAGPPVPVGPPLPTGPALPSVPVPPAVPALPVVPRPPSVPSPPVPPLPVPTLPTARPVIPPVLPVPLPVPASLPPVPTVLLPVPASPPLPTVPPALPPAVPPVLAGLPGPGAVLPSPGLPLPVPGPAVLPVLPVLSVTGGPSPVLVGQTVTATLASDVPGSVFLASLDGGAWQPTGPALSTVVAPGLHTLAVRAVDPAGTSSLPWSTSFTSVPAP